MSNYALSRLERLFLQMETTFGQVPNSGGTASVGNGNACRFIQWSFENVAATIQRPDKTGTRSQQIGVAGRRYAKWSGSMSVAPNGVAGVIPDMDPLLQGLMGAVGTVTAGTATITGATNASPIVVTATNTFALYDVVTITGAVGNTAANGTWMIIAVSGSGFTLAGSTGNGAWASGGTASRVGVKYTLTDSILSLSQYSFRGVSTMDQRVAQGSVVQTGTFALGADVYTANFDGESLWVDSSNQYSAADLTQKGGLTSFPTEPSAPVTNGNMIAGFTGLVVAGGATIATLRSITVKNANGNQVVKDKFGSYYGDSAEGDERTVTVQMSLYEDDSAGFAALVAASHSKTPLTIFALGGTTPGSMMGHVLQNVQLETHSKSEQRRFIADFPESRAHGSSLAARDEHVIWMM